MITLNDIDGPSEADLLATEVEDTSDLTVEEWEAMLDPIIVPESVEDWWSEDSNVHDSRWDDGIPSWSVWA